MADIVTEELHNAMVVYAAFGGSTNLLLHLHDRPRCWIPRPTCRVDAVNRATPRLVDVLPQGPGHPTARAYLAGGCRR